MVQWVWAAGNKPFFSAVSGVDDAVSGRIRLKGQVFPVVSVAVREKRSEVEFGRCRDSGTVSGVEGMKEKEKKKKREGENYSKYLWDLDGHDKGEKKK